MVSKRVAEAECHRVRRWHEAPDPRAQNGAQRRTSRVGGRCRHALRAGEGRTQPHLRSLLARPDTRVRGMPRDPHVTPHTKINLK